MRQKVRFIHTADLHLGSTLHITGEPGSKLNKLFSTAVFDAFRRVCNAALKHEVDFMVISGDIFDERQRSIKAVNFFNEQARRLADADINIYAITGNHDPFQEEDDLVNLPGNVHLFSAEEVETREIEDEKGRLIARVLGQSYRGPADSRKMYSFFTVPDEGVWNIGLLHTQLEGENTRYVPCTFNDLAGKNDIHYWGLGHIHQPLLLQPEKPLIAYAGIPQGRDFGEPGVGGCLLVDLIPGEKPAVNFIPTSSLVWLEAEVSINETEREPLNLADLKDLILRKAEKLEAGLPALPENFTSDPDNLSAIFSGYIIRWVITGRGKIHEILAGREEEAVQTLEEELRETLQYRQPFIWTEGVKLRTGPAIPDMEELKDRSELFAEIEEISRLCLKDNDLQDELIRHLGDIWGGTVDHENYEEDRFQVDEETFNDIVAQARDQVIARLWEERGEPS